MNAVTLEVESSKFANLNDRVEVFDASGHLLGQFMPANDRVAYIAVEVPEFTREDRRRAQEDIREGRVVTTAQVKEYLRGLETS